MSNLKKTQERFETGKGGEVMAIADGHDFPLAVYMAIASLMKPNPRSTSDSVPNPERMIGDRASDSDPRGQRGSPYDSEPREARD